MEKFFKWLHIILIYILILGWLGSCSLGIYEDKSNLIGLGAFLFIAAGLLSYCEQNTD